MVNHENSSIQIQSNIDSKRDTTENSRPNREEDKDKLTSLFCPCLPKVKRSFKLRIVTLLLVMALGFERYCFIVVVYKTEYFGYMLIMMVILLNMMFQWVNMRIRKDKHKRRLHEMFNLERTPSVKIFTIGLLG